MNLCPKPHLDLHVVSDAIDEMIDELPNENDSERQEVISLTLILKNKCIMSNPVNEIGYLSDIKFR